MKKHRLRTKPEEVLFPVYSIISIANQESMSRANSEKNNFDKFLKIFIIFLVILGWIFSGFPQIWNDPPIPPKIQEARAANYLTNPSFTGGTTGWTLTTTVYDSTYYQDTAGSVKTATAVGRNASGTGSAQQTISTNIQAGSAVLLSHYWSKQCVAINCALNTIQVDIAKPSAPTTWVTIWSDTSIPAYGSATAWTGPSNLDVSANFTENGQYIIRLYANLKNGNSATAQSLAWFDNVNLNVTPPTTTLATGSDPAANTIAPGAAETDVDVFTLQTSAGTEAISSVTVNLSTNSGVGLLAITDNANTVLGSTASPVTGSNTITVTGMSAGTTLATFKVRVTPLSHSAMPAPPGASYSITAPVTAWAGLNTHTGSDTNPNALTIDNASPADVTGASGTAGDAQVSFSWTNPADADFHSTVVLRRATTAVADVPVEGTTYIVGNIIGTATVACVVATPTATCTDTGLTNGTPYHYKIFTRDNYANYSSAGVVPTGSPFTPTALAPTLTFSLGANSLNLGALSATAVTAGSHTLTVGTNAANGVVVTYSGATLTSGANTITACSTNCASTAGSEQFGVNAVANTSPAVGAACSGTAPIASAATNYNTANSFRFVSGETVVSSTGTINSTTCTISYITNISNITEAGSYSTTLTYIATGTF